MSQLLSRFYIAAAVLLVVCSLGAWLAWNAPQPEEETEAEFEALSEVTSTLETELRTLPIDGWWDHVNERYDPELYWIEFDSIETLDKPTIALLKQEEMTDNTDDTGLPFMQRIVKGTDQVVSVSYQPDVYSRGFILDNAHWLIGLLALAGLPLLFSRMVVSPLRQQHQQLEATARNFASGNFSSRVPDSATVGSDEVGESFNEMASRIQTLVSQNDSLLEDHREMLRAVAHEFRGPLARIRFALDMTHDAGGKVSPELNADMGQGLDDLDLLVGEVLSYARLQPGTPMLNFERIAFDQIVIDAVGQATIANDETDIRTSAGSDSNTLIDADPYFLQRAILNLLNNGARHSDGTVVLHWRVEGEQCIVTVEDDGEGVPAAWRTRIFEPFVRVDPSRSRNSGGAGLGLAIVRRIIEKHGGEVSVGESDMFGGASFSLKWPVSPPRT